MRGWPRCSSVWRHAEPAGRSDRDRDQAGRGRRGRGVHRQPGAVRVGGGLLRRHRAAELEYAELETRLQTRSRELFRQLMQDHLDLQAQREQRLPGVIDAEQVARGNVETGHTRALARYSVR